MFSGGTDVCELTRRRDSMRRPRSCCDGHSKREQNDHVSAPRFTAGRHVGAGPGLARCGRRPRRWPAAEGHADHRACLHPRAWVHRLGGCGADLGREPRKCANASFLTHRGGQLHHPGCLLVASATEHFLARRSRTSPTRSPTRRSTSSMRTGPRTFFSMLLTRTHTRRFRRSVRCSIASPTSPTRIVECTKR